MTEHDPERNDCADDTAKFELPPDIRDELWTASLLLFVSECDLRAPVLTQVYCSDATTIRGRNSDLAGLPSLAETLYNIVEHTGFRTRLHWTSLDLCEVERNRISMAQDLCTVMRAIPWEDDWTGGLGHQYVNLQEALAMKQVILSSLKFHRDGVRIVNGSDSLVVIGAWAKGRSSSIMLNGIIRSCIGWLVIGRRALVNVYIPSKLNPSDDPSREVALRAPVLDPGLTAQEIDDLRHLTRLLCVSHMADQDRLIFDRWPPNAQERRLGWARLPHACLFNQIKLRWDESLRDRGVTFPLTSTTLR